MKLNRIELDGFGKLVKQVYEFSPGLNLIYGRNEAGKSTLQGSILAALYGFFDDGSITAAKKATMMAYEPWDARAAFGLKLAFEIDEGMQYRVDRTFAPKAETILYDLKSGKNINARFTSSSQGRLFFAEKLLGMPRHVFENTSLIRQAELAALEKSASAITDTLLRLSASASQESTASRALELLETALKEQVGTQRSRNKPLPEAQRRLESLQVARTHLQTEHQMLANQMLELAQAEESFQRLQGERDKLEYQRLLAQRLVARQQSQTIDDADADVERRQKAVSQYQAWSLFPPDAPPKIQRLTTQYEKALSDADDAEQTARHAKQRFLLLQTQLDGLCKTLNSTRATRDLPDLETQSATTATTALQNWLNEELSSLYNAIQERQKVLDLRSQGLNELNQIGHEGIAKDRQELGRLETDLTQARQAVQQLQQTTSKAGLPPEDQWMTILSDAHASAEKWQGWSNYPDHLRDELLQLVAQYTPLHESMATKSNQIADSEGKLAQLQTQLDTLQRQVLDLENVRNVPQQEKSRIQEIASQLEGAKQAVAEAHQQFREIDQIYQYEQQTFDLEMQATEPLEQLGITGLTQLQQRWLNAIHQLASAQPRFVQSQDTWNRVRMTVAEFQRLENTVKDIQSGIRPAPKPRRGCRSFFMSKRTGMVDQTPTEITIYSQVQPIYAEFIRQRDEVANSENTLRLIETELHQHLGQMIPDVIQENTFVNLLQQFQNSQQKAFHVEQRKGIWNTRRAQLQQAENRMQQIQVRLEKELQNFGFAGRNVDDAIELFLKACEKKEQLITAEAALERLQSQAAMVKQQWDQFQKQQQSLAQAEGEIIKLLAKAKIQVESGSLPEGIQRFEEGLESHRQWKAAQSRLEQIQTQIADFEERLSEARSTLTTNEEKLINFRQHLINKFFGLLPSDFMDQHLAQLDANLQAYYSAQSGIDIALGQLEQLQLQAQTIQRDMNDWAEKEDASKRLENEILQAVHLIGIEINQISLAEALHRFEEASQGFANWQRAQRFYDAAVQAQQAVRATLPKLETELARLEAKIEELSKQHSKWENLTVDDKPEVYERNLQKLNDQVLQERDRLTRLQESVIRSTKHLRHLAELDEEIGLVSADVQQLGSFSQALELAISELTITTREFQKVFAPRLERTMESGLEQITDGRYRQVKIDANSLNVQVLAPERNELVETMQLSTGTRDLVYLVLRMAITQLMSNSGEKLPLLLDDPLVEFDAIRQNACLEYLKNLSSQTQLFLFTKDDRIRDWFQDGRRDASHCKVIELE